jgi:hypothetical protein
MGSKFDVDKQTATVNVVTLRLGTLYAPASLDLKRYKQNKNIFVICKWHTALATDAAETDAGADCTPAAAAAATAATAVALSKELLCDEEDPRADEDIELATDALLEFLPKLSYWG